jgi:hypothetical protein
MERPYAHVHVGVIRETQLPIPFYAVTSRCDRMAFDHRAADIIMRKRVVYRSVSGTPVLKGDLVELNFVTDPAISSDDVTVEMSRSELDRLHRRISDRLSHTSSCD